MAPRPRASNESMIELFLDMLAAERGVQRIVGRGLQQRLASASVGGAIGAGGGDVVLGGQRVGRAQHDRCPARLQRAHEYASLRCHVQARADGHAVEWLLEHTAAAGVGASPVTAPR